MSKYNRRSFLGKTAVFLAGTQMSPSFMADAGRDSRRSVVLRGSSRDASTLWDYAKSAPWDHTVEPKTIEDPGSKGFRKDQPAPEINPLLGSMIASSEVPENNITIADPSRWIDPEIIKERCPYRSIKWVDSQSEDLWDANESVEFSCDLTISFYTMPCNSTTWEYMNINHSNRLITGSSSLS